MKAITTVGYSHDEFKQLILESLEDHLGRKLGTILEIGFVDEYAPKKIKDDVRYLTRGEVSKLLQISLPTLHHYTKAGYVRSYRLGGKVRYKAEDIERALTERNFTAVNRKGGLHA